MSIIAGIFSRTRDHPIEEAACEKLTQAISRDERDKPIVFRGDSIYLVKIDIGAYGAPAVHVGTDGSSSMLAGAPLLRLDQQPAQTRQDDLLLIGESLERGNREILRRARGQFALAHYSPGPPTLTLATDKVGLRTVYYWESPRYVVFASALRMLEDCRYVPKEIDLRAVTEIAVFGYPLSDRTAYAGIRALRPGEIVRFSGRETSRSQYWRWDEIVPGVRPEEELLQETFQRFAIAVKVRLAGDTITRSALTGGMDSRSVVGMLRHLNVLVHTFTFLPPNSLDQVLASLVAHRLGTFHEAIEEARQERWVALSKETWAASKARLRWPPERPDILWGGDGGSLLLGHIYMDEDLMALLRRGGRDAAIDGYCRRYCNMILPRLMRRNVYEQLKDVAVTGIREELDDVQTPDPIHAFYLFLIHNDQRRHLTGHFENVDVNRWELQAPFFDSDMMESIMWGPRDLYLSHRFYNKWLGLFPAVLASVPWQAYPGHVPCPLPTPRGMEYQWGGRRSREWTRIERERKRARLAQASAMLKDRAFTATFIHRPFFAAATASYATGLRDYGYVIDQAQTFYEYWQRERRVAPAATL